MLIYSFFFIYSSPPPPPSSSKVLANNKPPWRGGRLNGEIIIFGIILFLSKLDNANQVLDRLNLVKITLI